MDITFILVHAFRDKLLAVDFDLMLQYMYMTKHTLWILFEIYAIVHVLYDKAHAVDIACIYAIVHVDDKYTLWILHHCCCTCI